MDFSEKRLGPSATSDYMISKFWPGMFVSKCFLSCKPILKYQCSKGMPIASLKWYRASLGSLTAMCLLTIFSAIWIYQQWMGLIHFPGMRGRACCPFLLYCSPNHNLHVVPDSSPFGHRCKALHWVSPKAPKLAQDLHAPFHPWMKP